MPTKKPVLKVLFFGDVVGKIGRKAIKKALPNYRKQYHPDLVIANAENLAHGKGATKKTLEELINSGVNFFTSGNHIWSKKEIFSVFEENKIPIIRPANYPPEVPGKGYKIIEIGTKKILIINLLGRTFMEENLDCPFRKFKEIIEKHQKEELNAVIVDFHAEATSEKVAFGFYADGLASTVLGTHTHIPTADNQILPQGTAYISDVGMVGAKNSVLGVKKEEIINFFLRQIHSVHQIPEKGKCILNAVFLEINPKTKKAKSIKRADKIVEI